MISKLVNNKLKAQSLKNPNQKSESVDFNIFFNTNSFIYEELLYLISYIPC